MKKTFGIIGALLFVAAVAIGYFAKFDNADILQITLAAFGFATIVIGAVSNAKAKNVATWKIVLIVLFGSAAGILCAIGGLSQDVFKEIAGVVLALLTVIFGMLFDKKTA